MQPPVIIALEQGNKKMRHRFFYAKIGEANALAEDYIAGASEIQRPAIPIYFNTDFDNRADFIARGGSKEQGDNFFWCSDNQAHGHAVVIHQGKLNILGVCGEVIFTRSTIHPKVVNGFVKLLPIQPEKEFRLVDTPVVLASMTANAYYYTGTFREISDYGCLKALEMLTFGQMQSEEKGDPKWILSCLSSIELETMLAKLLEEHGLFVPAYRGGATKDIDIFAFNDSAISVTLTERIVVPAYSGVTFQVKRQSSRNCPPEGCDHLISVTNDAAWLVAALNRSPETNKWVKRSLSWLPSQHLKENGLL